MREIKFRGKAQDGKYYCGDLIHRDNVLNIRMCEGSNTYYIDVYPETVTQFVGYDKDGYEVYEGDKLVDLEEGYEHLVDLKVVFNCEEYEVGEKFYGYVLVEE